MFLRDTLSKFQWPEDRARAEQEELTAALAAAAAAADAEAAANAADADSVSKDNVSKPDGMLIIGRIYIRNFFIHRIEVLRSIAQLLKKTLFS